MNKLRKFLVVGVMVLSVISMSGLVIAPNVQASASAGDLIKMDGLSAVYYLSDNGKRYVFPNSTTYFSWYADFSGVVTIPAAELQSYPIGGNVVMRPGTKMIKITTDPSVYAVEPNGVLRKIGSESQASALYGTNWNKRIVDVADSYFVNYTVGTALTDGQIPAGSLVKNAGSAAVYYYDGTNYRSVASETALTANRLSMSNVLTVTNTLTAGGAAITGMETGLVKTSQNAVATGPVSVGSGLMVSLNSTTPAAATIPSSSNGVTFVKFNVTASNDGSVLLDTIKVKRTGVGAYSDLSGVYLYDGETRLTSAKTFASDTNEAEFSALNLNIAAGTTKTLSVVANIGLSKTGNHAIGIASASAINASGAAVSGSFPVTGNTMSLSATNSGSVTIDPVTTGLTDPTLGDKETAVASFKLTSTEDAWFKGITLKQDGTLTTSLLSGYKLYQGTTEVPATVSVNNRKVTLTLNSPFKLLNGSAKTFTVKADVSASAETTKTVVFFMDTTADLLVASDAYGFGLTTVITPYDTAGESKTLTLKGGAVTIANASASAHDVKTDTTAVELARVTMTSSSDTIEVQKLTAQITTTKATSGGDDWGTYRDTADDADYDSAVDTLLLRNIKVKDAITGQTLGSAKAITDATGWADSNDVDAALTFAWTDYFTVSKGVTRTLVLVADINSAAVSDIKYVGKFDFSSGNFTVKDSQDKTVTDIVPAAVIAGNTVTTKTSSLTVSRASTPESRTVVKGSSVDALGMIWAAGSGTGNDVKVSALTLDTYVDNVGTTDGTYVLKTEGTVNAQDLVQQVELYVDGVKIAGPTSVDSNGQAIFTSSKFVGGFYTVPAGSNKTVIVKAIASTNAPYGGDNDRFAFTMDAADMTAEDVNGSVTATVTGTNVNGTTAPSVGITVTAAGTITTAIDSGRPEAQVVIAGATAEQELTRVKLSTTKEKFVVDKLTAVVDEDGVLTGGSEATENLAAYDNVEYLKLYDSAGAALSGNVSLDSTGKASFTGLNIEVVNGTDKVVVIKGKLTAIGERAVATVGTAGTGADSGDTLAISVSTTAADFSATGAASGTVDNAADAAVSQVMIVRKTKPTVAALSLPVTSLADGAQTLYKFSVIADAAGDVVLKGIKPTMTLSDGAVGAALSITAGTVYLYDVTSGEIQLNTSGVNASALIEIDDAKIVTIAKGSTRTFEIRGTVAGSSAADSISTKVTKDGAALSAGTELATGDDGTDALSDGANAFVWSDKSADTNGVGSTEWTNSNLLSGWPTGVANMSR
ncbi:MAG: hypothetical protein WCT50_03105 [Patescibacteria group bacterium]